MKCKEFRFRNRLPLLPRVRVSVHPSIHPSMYASTEIDASMVTVTCAFQTPARPRTDRQTDGKYSRSAEAFLRDSTARDGWNERTV